MTDKPAVDVSREAVTAKIAFIEAALSTEGKPNRPRWPTHAGIHMAEAAAMLLALRDALDAAEKERTVMASLLREAYPYVSNAAVSENIRAFLAALRGE